MPAILFIPWWKPEPIDIGIEIHAFGILVAIAVIVGSRVSEEWGKRNGIAPRIIADFITHVIVTAFLMSYVLNSLFYEPEKTWEMLTGERALGYTGISSFGGFVGAVMGALIWKHKKKLEILAVGDAVCFGFPFGWIFGRMGCFTAHDHPGAITDFPLAVSPWVTNGVEGPARHDLGFYEMLWAIAASAIFFVLARSPKPRGFYWAALPILYAPIRFFMDYLRATDDEGGDVRYLGLTPGQYGALLLFAGGLAVAWWIRAHPPTIPPEAAYDPNEAASPPTTRKRKN